MQYLGGKSRIAKEIANVILDRALERWMYVEPFLGAGAVAAELAPYFSVAQLSDASPDLIALWQALKDGWQPPEQVSQEDYDAQRNAEISALRGFVGYGCSFGGKWFGGYARDPKHGRNFARTANNLLTKRIAALDNAEFSTSDYRDIPVFSGSVVYCDPPYRSMTGYARLAGFDSDEFWKRAEFWSKDATVFVSEYQAPKGWLSVWQATPRVTLRVDSNSPRPTEHLWVWTGG